MKVGLEEGPGGQQRMSPPGRHSRTKSGSMGSIVVDMGNKGGGELEVRGAMDMMYSPNKKAAALRPDPASRIHLIPLLMILVFIVLWAGSTEVPLGEDAKLGAVTVSVPLEKNLATSGKLKVEDSSTGSEDVGGDHERHEKGYLRGGTLR